MLTADLVAGALVAHLTGDYILQTDRMATLKISQLRWAVVHGIFYTLPFVLLTRSPAALAVICLTHIVIDRWRLARYVVALKNSLGDWSRRAEFFGAPMPPNGLRSTTGYAVGAPDWLAFWLLIITDNTMHLAVNFAALKWL